MGQAQPRIQPGNPLDTSETTSNVATNRAMLDALKAANVDGKNINPAQVDTDHLYANNGIFQGYMASGSLFVGAGGVAVSSSSLGAEPSAAGIFMGISSGDPFFYLKDTGGNQTVTFNGATGAATFKGTIAAGSTVSATMTTGAIYVGSGGVTISNDAAANNGIVIDANQIRCIVGGSPTITIDGATGVVTANKFALTSDSASTVNLSAGSITIGASASVGGQTASTTVTNANAGATKITSFYQSSAPTALNTGDIWVDSDDLKTFRWNGSNWTTQVGNVNTTFAQTSAPSALAAGDIWVDTDDGNKMYRATAAGTGSWVAVMDPVNAGGYLTLDTSNNITNIDTAGITIGTATSGARVQINSSGLICVNAGGTTTVSVKGADGIVVNNVSGTPDVTERLSLAYSGTEKAYLYAATATLYVYSDSSAIIIDNSTATTKDITISASGSLKLSSSANDIQLNSDMVVASGKELRFEAGAVDPTITAGAAPSELDASSEPLGSILLAVGGSLWLTISSSGNKWTRIYGKNATAATAHS